MEHKQRPEDVLEQMYLKHGAELKRLDRNFIKEIVYGGLRWYSKIYWILQNTSKRDLATTTPENPRSLSTWHLSNFLYGSCS